MMMRTRLNCGKKPIVGFCGDSDENLCSILTGNFVNSWIYCTRRSHTMELPIWARGMDKCSLGSGIKHDTCQLLRHQHDCVVHWVDIRWMAG